MRQFVLFQEASALFALEASCILEIGNLPHLSQFPGAPDHVLGIFDYRGRMTPVLDLQRRLSGGTCHLALSDHLVVFESRGNPMAILVDSALTMGTVDDSELRPLSHVGLDGYSERARRFLLGMLTIESRVHLVLDPDALLHEPEPGDEAARPSQAMAGFAGADLETLRERAIQLAAPPPEAAGETVTFVLARLGGERFGFDVQGVDALGPIGAITAVPGAPDQLLGLMYYRGQLLRLLDIRSRLGLPTSATDLREVVVLRDGGEGQGLLTGVAVDVIDGVVSAERPPTEPVAGESLVVETVLLEGGWIRVLDCRHPSLFGGFGASVVAN